MSLNARASRGASEKFNTGGVAGQFACAVPMKHRYVAVTSRLVVYEVLNTRTSEKNGFPPTKDAAAGSVTRSARSDAAAARKIDETITRVLRMGQPLSVNLLRKFGPGQTTSGRERHPPL